MKFGTLYNIVARIASLKQVKMDFKSTYSLLQLQNAIMKNTMFNELEKKVVVMANEVNEKIKNMNDEEKEPIMQQFQKELEELSNIEIEGIDKLSLSITIDPDEKMFLTIEDINFFRSVLGDNFVLIDKSNDLQIVI